MRRTLAPAIRGVVSETSALRGNWVEIASAAGTGVTLGIRGSSTRVPPPRRVLGIDRGVGLDEVVHRIQPSARDRAYDALGHRLPDAEGIAHPKHNVVDRDVVDVGERDGLQVVRVDLEQRTVRFRIAATMTPDARPFARTL